LRILLLNEYYPPDSSATSKMAAAVVGALSRKHLVRVVAGRPSYDTAESYPWRLLRRETSGNVTIERVGSTAFPRFQMRRRVANYLTYAFLTTIRACTVSADIVLAMTDPPFAGLLGAFVSTVTGRPFVYNIRDLYPDMAVGGDIVKPGVLVRFWEWLHRWALRRAKCVIVLGDDMRDRIISKGVDPTRVTVVRDGVSIPTTLPAPGNDVAREIRGDLRFVALHAGNIGFYGAWDTILEAARRLGDDGLGIIFVGEGAEKARLVARANGTRSLRFLSYRPASEVPQVLSAADVHIITVKRGLEGIIVPSKLYPVLAAGKPVLAVARPNTDVARIITQAGCGVVVDPDDAEAVAAVIRELAGQPERLAEMGRRARAIAPEYNASLHLDKFVLALEGAYKG
jgi:glycosyltransferase involved in cell wall biosynthesis